MFSFLEARSLILSEARTLDEISVAYDEALGCCLAEPLVAELDSPMFDNSAVDGFAVRVSDIAAASPANPIRLAIGRTVAAGASAGVELNPGKAARIFTGAPIPPSAQAVVMQEDCEWDEREVAVKLAAKEGANIRLQGEEYRQGDMLLPAGTRVTPPVVGLLASNGVTRCRVYRKPRVAIVSTGSELIAPGQVLKNGSIYESNGPALAAAVRMLGIADLTVAVVSDDAAEIRRALGDALEAADVLITSGGVSVGAHDLVKDTLAGLGVEERIWRVAMRPGKPFYFGVREGLSRGDAETRSFHGDVSRRGADAQRARRDLGRGGADSGIHNPQSKIQDSSESPNTQNSKLNTSRSVRVFGLPGNPVSALICFQLFVRPALLKMVGFPEEELGPVSARLVSDVVGHGDRAEFVRARLYLREGVWVADSVRSPGSHMLGGLAVANALIYLQPGCESLPKGALAEVYPVEWSP